MGWSFVLEEELWWSHWLVHLHNWLLKSKLRYPKVHLSSPTWQLNKVLGKTHQRRSNLFQWQDRSRNRLDGRLQQRLHSFAFELLREERKVHGHLRVCQPGHWQRQQNHDLRRSHSNWSLQTAVQHTKAGDFTCHKNLEVASACANSNWKRTPMERSFGDHQEKHY